MKKLNLIYALLFLYAFTSCQKDRSTQVDTSGNKPQTAAPIRDSISYTINGKLYVIGSVPGNFSSAHEEEVDRKVVYADTNNKFNYGLFGIPDSVLFYQKQNIISSKSNNLQAVIFFIKKFKKKNQKDGLSYFPELKEWTQLFTIGKHPYAEDFGWQNSQDGIAFIVPTNNGPYISYNPFDPHNPSILKPGFQKNSTFEIINFTKSTYGMYNLEARFTAVISNAQGTQKLENGYLSLYIGPVVLADPTD